MKKATNTRGKEWMPLAVAVGFAVFGGVGLWYFGVPSQEFLRSQEEHRRDREGSPLLKEEAQRVRAVAERYVRAVQAGNCGDVIALTYWMQERLALARTEGDVDAVTESFCKELRSQGIRERVLAPEGAEDWHVLLPHAQVKILGTDSGREDLEAPARGRVWLRVRYPAPSEALRSYEGPPVKELIAGINVSEDGFVLKGAVTGNLEIDEREIQYYW